MLSLLPFLLPAPYFFMYTVPAKRQKYELETDSQNEYVQ